MDCPITNRPWEDISSFIQSIEGFHSHIPENLRVFKLRLFGLFCGQARNEGSSARTMDHEAECLENLSDRGQAAESGKTFLTKSKEILIGNPL